MWATSTMSRQNSVSRFELGLEIRTRPQCEHLQTGTVVEEGVVDEWSSTSVGAEAPVARTQEPEVLKLNAQVADEAEGSAGHPELGWVDEALGNATAGCGESELVLAVQDWQGPVPDLSADADRPRRPLEGDGAAPLSLRMMLKYPSF